MPQLSYLLPTRLETGVGGKLTFRWDVPGGPFGAEVEIATNPTQTSVQILKGAFTAAECDQIIALGESGGRVSGEIEKGYSGMRVSELTWIDPDDHAHWVYHRIGMLLMRANEAYGFRLVGLQEPLQFSRYGVGGRFDWHVDAGGTATAGRKLSLSVQLSDSADYAGGDLEFLNNTGSPARERGTAILFPSFLSHRVTPVISGLRRTLIAWAYGPAFT